MRHGKSSWDHPVSDRSRPLQARGINDVSKVGDFFAEQGYKIDAVYSSPAERAAMTCSIFCSSIDWPLEKVVFNEKLYDFSGDLVSKVVENLNDEWHTVMIFGHNFALTKLANSWGDEAIANVPTGGLVMLSFEVNSWRKVGTNGKTELFIKPKQISI